MQRSIITTADGSKTIQIKDWNEQYHSVHGAIQEANHVYIKHGLLFFYAEKLKQPQSEISILEIGFGTGLNALLTQLKAEELIQSINYVGVEAFPISSEELEQLNYTSELDVPSEKLKQLHSCSWEEEHQISEVFKLKKQQQFFKDISVENMFDVIYFDAFGARVQPELWTEDIFKIMHRALKQNGVLTTYAAIGSVRRTLIALGFEVERLDGPPGKRHMLRAVKR
ncbi:tRNA (5-methylaminomethyl-2-thiouridine)(34)-methyltransferase MnmD [Psychroserpens burtonensis]|uniref:tRNA (5-methylaminomethyl-2-thiouridine)(34)-methyltransferase MnmD n=1 Tax=Psychroserpens burtonensis TaxID=49278 RepID=A0A5C7BGF1_9FLAO|nr:tRNA (5-methylaminomethyl-2-thiouridine)(34)-methyltransferase MnmD [Psychroserpens burtonensis]TXE18535.1 tRNA (5-methylaminomethyl-2-thiouridine)(34)-methyltransferase MnmD [Psychroserpens burtonensis]